MSAPKVRVVVLRSGAGAREHFYKTLVQNGANEVKALRAVLAVMLKELDVVPAATTAPPGAVKRLAAACTRARKLLKPTRKETP